MRICIVIVLVNVVCGDVDLPSIGTDHVQVEDDSQTAPKSSMGYCFFGDLPSASCTFNCLMKRSSPFCDDLGWCFCSSDKDEMQEDKSHKVPSPAVPTPQPTDSKKPEDIYKVTDDEEDKPGHMTLFFFDLGSLFGGNNDTKVESKTSESTDSDLKSGLSFWTLDYILITLTVVIFTILVTLEARKCMVQRAKKQRSIQAVLNLPENEKTQLG